MLLGRGAKLGPYEVLAPLGAGGMGEVYRATDTKLGRDVAIKVLPAEVAGDPERLARLRREAHVLASLNHANIGAIHGLEESDGVVALVLELVEGEDLSERLKRGAVPVDEALEIARQIAEALEEAHEHGIVHRDLKPANIKLTRNGKVKVLDFGLAKAYAEDGAGQSSPEVSHSPTLSAQGTRAGVILGTAAYMAPEQARGKPVDKRADIWAFGVVLFEMLSGKRLFTGETTSDVLAAVLTRQPDWKALPTAAAGLRGVLARCLERDPRRRLRDAGDVRQELERFQPGEGTLDAVSGVHPEAARWRTWAAVAGAMVVGGLLSRLLMPAAQEARPPLRLSIQLAAHQELTGFSALTFSPDGETLVFAAVESGQRRLFRRRLNAPQLVPIEGTEDGAFPSFSPDGRWLGFIAGGRLRKVAADGGRPFDLADQQGAGGAAWLSNDTLVFTPIYSDGLFTVSAEGGAAQRLTTPDRGHGELGHWWAQALPGNKTVLFTAFRTPEDESRVGVVRLETREVRYVVDGGFYGRYVPTGHLLYVKGRRLFAAPFDPDRAAITGSAKQVLEDVFASYTSGYSILDVSSRGTLAYVSGSVANAPRELVSVDRSGRIQPVSHELRRYQGLSVSPDAKQLAVTIRADSLDLWTLALDRGTLSRLTATPGSEFGPLWSRDGREIFFTYDRPLFEVHRIAFGSAADARPLWKEPAELDTVASALSPDGRLLAFTLDEMKTGSNIWVRPVDGSEPARSFRATPFAESFPSFSPDGRWLAYESDETGRSEIYVEAFPGPGDRRRVSPDGGSEPLWARGSGELFYRRGDELRVLSAKAGTIAFSPPETLITLAGSISPEVGSRSYDVTHDGRRVFTARTPREHAPRRIDVVTDWLQELKRLVPVDGR